MPLEPNRAIQIYWLKRVQTTNHVKQTTVHKKTLDKFTLTPLIGVIK